MKPLRAVRRIKTRSAVKAAALVLAVVAGLVFAAGILSAQTVTPAPAPSPTVAPIDPSIYLPQATVQIAASPAPSANSTAVSSKVAADTTSANSAAAAVLPPLEVCAPDAFAITTLAPSQTATVTLTYNGACAGMTVVIAPLDGGSVNASAGSKQVTVGKDGTACFSFQAPAAAGLYNVLAVLGGYQRVLPFQVNAKTAGS